MNRQILIVDDEENIRFSFRRFLEKKGYPVLEAADFDSALALARTETVDLAFVDIMLGDRTGIDLLRELRALHPLTPVILITGAPSVESAASALRLGALDYVTKPVKLDTLLRVTENALRLKQTADEREEYRRNFEAIMRSVKEAIITFDTDGRITQLNPAATHICGLNRKHLGQSLEIAGNGCMKQCVPSLLQTLKSKETMELNRVQCIQQDRTLVVSTNISPLLGSGGKILGAVLVVRDETTLNSLENRLRDQYQFHGLIGSSPPMRQIYDMIEELASLPTTVLVTGESGTGKELVAEALHYQGSRHDKPLVKLNCAALPENLLESELFGHVKGAFTGALKDKKGRFEMADGGTIFLDEIGDISPATQVRLLRVLQEREIERVGEGTPRKVDTRVIAATNRDLAAKVADGTFREDLYYRLRVVHLKVPPLRERAADIPLLAEHFLKQLNRKLDKEVLGISPRAMEILEQHHWPGNVREFEHVLENAMALCRRAVTLGPEHLNLCPTLQEAPAAAHSEELSDLAAVKAALEKTDGNKAKAARILGISRPTLYRKIQEYSLDT